MKKRSIKLGIFIALSLALSGCGFHLRSASELPPQLHELCLETPKFSKSFTSKLINMLTSLNLKVDSSCVQAPYQLHVYSISLSHDNPAIAEANQAVTFNYIYSVDFELQNNQGQTIVPRRTLTATRAVILNAQQIFTPYNTDSIEKQLQQMVLNQIFDQLTTSEIKNNFARYPAH